MGTKLPKIFSSDDTMEYSILLARVVPPFRTFEKIFLRPIMSVPAHTEDWRQMSRQSRIYTS